jgi:low affinity Fe/Cu permease
LTTPIKAVGTLSPAAEPTQPATLEGPPGLFLRFANWVSEAMGRPVNIAFWFVLIVIWTLVFALGGRRLASGSWLPAWFTSTGYNFPLNLITTVAELFIGFLVAAAANRAQDALTALLGHIRAAVERDTMIEQGLREALAENTELTMQVHDLQLEMSRQTALLDEIHRHVGALTPNAGRFPPPPDSGVTSSLQERDPKPPIDRSWGERSVARDLTTVDVQDLAGDEG